MSQLVNTLFYNQNHVCNWPRAVGYCGALFLYSYDMDQHHCVHILLIQLIWTTI
jgi:hypothetical protein